MTLAERCWNVLHRFLATCDSFYDNGLMDVIRTALVVVLAYGIWIVPMPGVGNRPVRDFMRWGIRYPFPCAVTVLLALIIWGVVGGDYGLRDLFLDEPSLQFQLGIMASMTVLAMIFHCYLAEFVPHNWRGTVEQTLEVCSRFDGTLPKRWSVLKLLRNGFINRLSADDTRAIGCAIDRKRAHDRMVRSGGPKPLANPAGSDAGPEWWRSVLQVVQNDAMFRILFAPAMLLVDSCYVVLLLGVIPFLLGNGIGPWLLGTIAGTGLACAIACWSSNRLAIAACDDRVGCELLLIPEIDTTDRLPTHGRDLVCVAFVKDQLHVRIFDWTGMRVVNKDESELLEAAEKIDPGGSRFDALKRKLKSASTCVGITVEQRDEILIALTPLVGYSEKRSRYAPLTFRLWKVLPGPAAPLDDQGVQRDLRAGWFDRSIIAFLLIQFVVGGFLAWFAPWVTSRSAKPEPAAILTLIAEVLLSMFIALAWGRRPDRPRDAAGTGRSRWFHLWDRKGHWGQIVLAVAGILLGLYALLTLSSIFRSPPGYSVVLLGVYLAIWMACFRLTTSRSLRGLEWEGYTKLISGVSFVCVLLAILSWSDAQYRGAELLGVLAFSLPMPWIYWKWRWVRPARPSARVPFLSSRPRIALAVAGSLSAVGVAYWSFVPATGPDLPLPSALCILMGILAVAVLVLAAILETPNLITPDQGQGQGQAPSQPSSSADPARQGSAADHPKEVWRSFALVYPSSVVFSFAAFAIVFGSLAEVTQAAMPAGASLLILFGLLAAMYMIAKLTHHRRDGILIVGLLIGLFALNGNSWRIDPNQFKLQFPDLAAYYDRTERGPGRGSEPVNLDSRAYFRSTASSVVKLRDLQKLRIQERRANRHESELPASVLFEVDPTGQALAIADALTIGINDPRGSCRAIDGDRVVLYFPEELLQAAGPTIGNEHAAPGSIWSFTIKAREDQVVTFLPRRPETEYRLSRSVLPHVYLKANRLRLQIGSSPARRGNPVPEVKVVELDRFVEPDDSRSSVERPSFEISSEGGGNGQEILLKIHGMRGGLPQSVGVSAVFDAKVHAAESRPTLAGSDALDFLVAIPALKEWQAALKDSAEQDRKVGRGMNGTFEEALRNCLDESHMALDRALALEADHLASDEMLQYVIREKLAAQPGDFLVLEGRPKERASGDAIGDDTTRPRGGAREVDPNDGGPQGRTSSQPVPLQTFLAPIGPADERHRALVGLARPTEVISVNLLRTLIESRRWPANRLSLRVVHDRSLFRFDPKPGRRSGPMTMDLARGGRVRVGDRLIIRWQEGPEAARKDRYELAEVKEVEAGGKGSLGFQAVELAPWGGEWTFGAEGEARVPISVGPPPPPIVGCWEIVRSLNNLESLEAWKKRTEPWWREKNAYAPPTKPPLVIVTVSGGGIRASVWTATVLEALERQLGSRFPYQIRLITGASGGMVAAAYYATGLEEPAAAATDPPDRTSNPEGSLSSRMAELAEDQLNSVAGCMIFNDIPGLLNPLHRSMDRGIKIEEAWIRRTGQESSPLLRPLRAFAADERAGWRPSLAFTPMMVEDGRRLLISNLDLGFVTRNYGRLLHEWGSNKLDPSYLQDLQPFSRLDDELYSLSALEFYKLFPAAWDVKVSTAIRMSASFPWIAPAVSLPTSPPRRVVDAGYYDNYGINLAAQWLTEFRYWLAENTSGVLVIQIRDGVSQKARTEIGFDQATDASAADVGWLNRMTWLAGPELLEPGFHPLTTPMRGISSARQWSMSFRNDEQVELFDRLLDEIKPGEPDFFRTVVFECPVEASVSWKLTEDEKIKIRAGMGDNPFELRKDPTNARPKLLNFREEDRAKLDSLDLDRDVAKTLSQEDYLAERKKLFDLELAKLGYGGAENRTNRESQDLYNNVLNNVRRLELVRAWWQSR